MCGEHVDADTDVSFGRTGTFRNLQEFERYARIYSIPKPLRAAKGLMDVSKASPPGRPAPMEHILCVLPLAGGFASTSPDRVPMGKYCSSRLLSRYSLPPPSKHKGEGLNSPLSRRSCAVLVVTQPPQPYHIFRTKQDMHNDMADLSHEAVAEQKTLHELHPDTGVSIAPSDYRETLCITPKVRRGILDDFVR